MKHLNVALIVGVIVQTPEERELADGSKVTEFNVRVSEEGKPSSTVPITLEGILGIPVGTEVIVAGRVRRRFYRAGGSTVSRTVILAVSVIPARAEDLPKVFRHAMSGS